MCSVVEIKADIAAHALREQDKPSKETRKEGDMLGDKEPIGTLAVKDLAVAKKFYQGTLGLKLEDETGTEAHTYRSGGARLIVYRSEFAGTNKATALNFIV